MNIPRTPEVDRIIKAAFPDYRGRTIRLEATPPGRLDSYWDGGSRDYFAFVELRTGRTLPVHSNHPAFEPGQPSTLRRLPSGLVLVRRSYFCGKDAGFTIYANPEDLAPALPAPADLTEDERIVLTYTAALKNTYGGRRDIRFTEAQADSGISRDRWTAAQCRLYARRLLTAANAITPEGENALAAAGRWTRPRPAMPTTEERIAAALPAVAATLDANTEPLDAERPGSIAHRLLETNDPGPLFRGPESN